MVAMMLAAVAFGAESFAFEAPLIDNLDLGDDFDHAAFREDVRDLDGELTALLASKSWYTVGVQGARSPAEGRLWGFADALTVHPTFTATARATIPSPVMDEEEPSYTTQSNAHVRTEAGRVVAAAGGVVEHSFGCGSYTGYTDWLVTYDAEGNPNLFYSTENGHGEELVLHTETVGQVEYDESGVPVALDVRTRQRWIGCDLCSNDLVGTDDWDDVTWSHARYVFVTGDTDLVDASGC